MALYSTAPTYEEDEDDDALYNTAPPPDADDDYESDYTPSDTYEDDYDYEEDYSTDYQPAYEPPPVDYTETTDPYAAEGMQDYDPYAAPAPEAIPVNPPAQPDPGYTTGEQYGGGYPAEPSEDKGFGKPVQDAISFINPFDEPPPPVVPSTGALYPQVDPTKNPAMQDTYAATTDPYFEAHGANLSQPPPPDAGLATATDFLAATDANAGAMSPGPNPVTGVQGMLQHEAGAYLRTEQDRVLADELLRRGTAQPTGPWEPYPLQTMRPPDQKAPILGINPNRRDVVQGRGVTDPSISSVGEAMGGVGEVAGRAFDAWGDQYEQAFSNLTPEQEANLKRRAPISEEQIKAGLEEFSVRAPILGGVTEEVGRRIEKVPGLGGVGQAIQAIPENIHRAPELLDQAAYGNVELATERFWNGLLTGNPYAGMPITDIAKGEVGSIMPGIEEYEEWMRANPEKVNQGENNGYTTPDGYQWPPGHRAVWEMYQGEAGSGLERGIRHASVDASMLLAPAAVGTKAGANVALKSSKPIIRAGGRALDALSWAMGGADTLMGAGVDVAAQKVIGGVRRLGGGYSSDTTRKLMAAQNDEMVTGVVGSLSDEFVANPRRADTPAGRPGPTEPDADGGTGGGGPEPDEPDAPEMPTMEADEAGTAWGGGYIGERRTLVRTVELPEPGRAFHHTTLEDGRHFVTQTGSEETGFGPYDTPEQAEAIMNAIERGAPPEEIAAVINAQDEIQDGLDDASIAEPAPEGVPEAPGVDPTDPISPGWNDADLTPERRISEVGDVGIYLPQADVIVARSTSGEYHGFARRNPDGTWTAKTSDGNEIGTYANREQAFHGLHGELVRTLPARRGEMPEAPPVDPDDPLSPPEPTIVDEPTAEDAEAARLADEVIFRRDALGDIADGTDTPVGEEMPPPMLDRLGDEPLSPDEPSLVDEPSAAERRADIIQRNVDDISRAMREIDDGTDTPLSDEMPDPMLDRLGDEPLSPELDQTSSKPHRLIRRRRGHGVYQLEKADPAQADMPPPPAIDPDDPLSPVDEPSLSQTSVKPHRRIRHPRGQGVYQLEKAPPGQDVPPPPGVDPTDPISQDVDAIRQMRVLVGDDDTFTDDELVSIYHETADDALMQRWDEYNDPASLSDLDRYGLNEDDLGEQWYGSFPLETDDDILRQMRSIVGDDQTFTDEELIALGRRTADEALEARWDEHASTRPTYDADLEHVRNEFDLMTAGRDSPDIDSRGLESLEYETAFDYDQEGWQDTNPFERDEVSRIFERSEELTKEDVERLTRLREQVENGRSRGDLTEEEMDLLRKARQRIREADAALESGDVPPPPNLPGEQPLSADPGKPHRLIGTQGGVRRLPKSPARTEDVPPPPGVDPDDAISATPATDELDEASLDSIRAAVTSIEEADQGIRRGNQHRLMGTQGGVRRLPKSPEPRAEGAPPPPRVDPDDPISDMPPDETPSPPADRQRVSPAGNLAAEKSTPAPIPEGRVVPEVVEDAKGTKRPRLNGRRATSKEVKDELIYQRSLPPGDEGWDRADAKAWRYLMRYQKDYAEPSKNVNSKASNNWVNLHAEWYRRHPKELDEYMIKNNYNPSDIMLVKNAGQGTPAEGAAAIGGVMKDASKRGAPGRNAAGQALSPDTYNPDPRNWPDLAEADESERGVPVWNKKSRRWQIRPPKSDPKMPPRDTTKADAEAMLKTFLGPEMTTEKYDSATYQRMLSVMKQHGVANFMPGTGRPYRNWLNIAAGLASRSKRELELWTTILSRDKSNQGADRLKDVVNLATGEWEMKDVVDDIVSRSTRAEEHAAEYGASGIPGEPLVPEETVPAPDAEVEAPAVVAPAPAKKKRASRAKPKATAAEPEVTEPLPATEEAPPADADVPTTGVQALGDLRARAEGYGINVDEVMRSVKPAGEAITVEEAETAIRAAIRQKLNPDAPAVTEEPATAAPVDTARRRELELAEEDAEEAWRDDVIKLRQEEAGWKAGRPVNKEREAHLTAVERESAARLRDAKKALRDFNKGTDTPAVTEEPAAPEPDADVPAPAVRNETELPDGYSIKRSLRGDTLTRADGTTEKYPKGMSREGIIEDAWRHFDTSAPEDGVVEMGMGLSIPGVTRNINDYRYRGMVDTDTLGTRTGGRWSLRHGAMYDEDKEAWLSTVLTRTTNRHFRGMEAGDALEKILRMVSDASALKTRMNTMTTGHHTTAYERAREKLLRLERALGFGESPPPDWSSMNRSDVDRLTQAILLREMDIEKGVLDANGKMIDDRHGFIRFIDGVNAFTRKLTLYDPLGVPGYIMLNLLGNAITMGIARPASVIDYFTAIPSSVRKQLGKGGDGWFGTSWTDTFFDGTGLPKTNFLGASGRDQLPDSEDLFKVPGARQAGKAFGMQLGRDVAVGIDAAVREAGYRAVAEPASRALQRAFVGTNRTTGAIMDTFRSWRLSGRMPGGFVTGADITRVISDLPKNGQFRPEDLRDTLLRADRRYDALAQPRPLPGTAGVLPTLESVEAAQKRALEEVANLNPDLADFADRLGRDWQHSLGKLHKAAKAEADRLGFPGNMTKLDAAMSRFLLFHYWNSRASRLYITEAIRKPYLLAAYFNMMDYSERMAEESGAPPWVKQVAGYYNTPSGFLHWINPAGIFSTMAVNQQTEPGAAGTRNLTPFGAAWEEGINLFNGGPGELVDAAASSLFNLMLAPIWAAPMYVAGMMGEDATPPSFGFRAMFNQLTDIGNLGQQVLPDNLNPFDSAEGNPSRIPRIDPEGAVMGLMAKFLSADRGDGKISQQVQPRNTDSGEEQEFMATMLQVALEKTNGDVEAAAELIEGNPEKGIDPAAFNPDDPIHIEALRRKTAADWEMWGGTVDDDVPGVLKVLEGLARTTADRVVVSTNQARHEVQGKPYPARDEDDHIKANVIQGGSEEANRIDQEVNNFYETFTSGDPNTVPTTAEQAGARFADNYSLIKGTKQGMIMPFVVGEVIVTQEMLEAMNPEQRQIVANDWLDAVGGRELRDHYYDAQANWFDRHPEAATAVRLSNVAEAYPAGVESWVSDTRELNAPYDQYMREVESRGAVPGSPEWVKDALSPNAYTAIKGEENNSATSFLGREGSPLGIVAGAPPNMSVDAYAAQLRREEAANFAEDTPEFIAEAETALRTYDLMQQEIRAYEAANGYAPDSLVNIWRQKTITGKAPLLPEDLYTAIQRHPGAVFPEEGDIVQRYIVWGSALPPGEDGSWDTFLAIDAAERRARDFAVAGMGPVGDGQNGTFDPAGIFGGKSAPAPNSQPGMIGGYPQAVGVPPTDPETGLPMELPPVSTTPTATGQIQPVASTGAITPNGTGARPSEYSGQQAVTLDYINIRTAPGILDPTGADEYDPNTIFAAFDANVPMMIQGETVGPDGWVWYQVQLPGNRGDVGWVRGDLIGIAP